MRKFIVSDLYGDKVMFDLIFSYLEDLDEDIFLVLNGNMIGLELDIYEKMKSSRNIIIEYLGGNLELECYQRLSSGQYKEYLGDLNTYYLFQEGIYHRPFLVSHGDVPNSICFSSKIKDNDSKVFNTVNRRADVFDQNYATRQYMGAFNYRRRNNSFCFFIRGGIPIHNREGFSYNPYDYTIMIDGGCKNYLKGDLEYDHVPLVEVQEGKLDILTFNHEGDIISHHILDGKLQDITQEKVKLLCKRETL